MKKSLSEKKQFIFFERIKRILEIYTFSKECFVITSYFQTSTLSKDYELLSRYNSLYTIKYATMHVSIIELLKLYDPKGEQSIIRFIKRCVIGDFYLDLKKNDWLITCLYRIENEIDLTDLINRLKDFRDKKLAHTDTYQKITSVKAITYEELKQMLNLTFEILTFFKPYCILITEYIDYPDSSFQELMKNLN
ncbi:hypothetical protein [Mucilaginibacter jinjuensis]|uniref:HEPN AbiU2-like domain-containing protein n=1 Tax=Mucilaginibacter jinjuensis TaxID=1176721 RepID=A0ABY7T1N1_9SPHI|nr:hypothetical protein [Mucilaginibacter jinjuensis]WCT10355.1 hypothetical protein PQO05_16590 [Mucilaginibacter jinjuensis]